ncbi:MAG TPA: CPBP family intramembrane glutamic endopeptidase [Candidatus Acidoferrum sp.]|nr:CPBP family intramembrane glutamic endopeptidase [Candidatus Acidoferrum sp.]
MTIGWVFHLDADSYLVAGVPLVVIFQLFVRKKPLVTLWMREATRFRLNTVGIILAVGFAIMPALELTQTVRSADRLAHVPEILWFGCCITGALGAAFGFCHFTKRTWKELGFCLLTAGVIGCGTMSLHALAAWALQHHAPVLNWHTAMRGVGSFMLYVPVCFVLEEVAFRGAIDSHIFQPGDRGQWWTAIFVSALWGWWHLPIVPIQNFSQLVVLVLVLPCIHIAVGAFLSLGWRRSGNLAVPATVHAFIDAIRNMLL